MELGGYSCLSSAMNSQTQPNFSTTNLKSRRKLIRCGICVFHPGASIVTKEISQSGLNNKDSNSWKRRCPTGIELRFFMGPRHESNASMPAPLTK